MEKKQPDFKTKFKAALKYLASCMHFRSKPGCTTCLTPIMDQNGRPVVGNPPAEE